jgi:hypothetical protein
VHIECKECVDEICFDPEAQRDSTKLSLCKECKATAARRAQSPARTKSCVRICCKECTDPDSAKCRRDSIRVKGAKGEMT